MAKRRLRGWAVFATSVWLLEPSLARAESLADAIALAYQSNPTLQAQRAQLRELDETYVQAAAGLRPTVNAQLSTNFGHTHLGTAAVASQRFFDPTYSAISETNGASAQVIIDQPILTFGRVSSAIAGARLSIKAGRETLNVGEQDLLLSVVDAYTSVQRDEGSLLVREKGLAALQRQVDEARARRVAGEVTLSDVAQAEAQLENERALLAQARQQLDASRLNYGALVGQNPGSLDPTPPLPHLPATVDQAFDLAEAASPELKAAILTEKASREAIRTARAQFRPSIAAEVAYGYEGAAVPFVGRNDERVLTAQAVLSQPLFEGGQLSAALRRASEQNNSDRFNIEIVRRRVVQTLGNDWNQMLTAQQNVETQKRQVTAAATEYEGMQAEYRAGLRSTFDVLYAEQTLRNSELLLLQARHDAYVGEAAVLRYTGVLDVADLTNGVPRYDPTKHLHRAQREGALPWDGLVQGLDRLSGPGVGQKPLKQVAGAFEPSIIATSASQDLSAAAPAANLPLRPIPGSTADGVASPRRPHTTTAARIPSPDAHPSDVQGSDATPASAPK